MNEFCEVRIVHGKENVPATVDIQNSLGAFRVCTACGRTMSLPEEVPEQDVRPVVSADVVAAIEREYAAFAEKLAAEEIGELLAAEPIVGEG